VRVPDQGDHIKHIKATTDDLPTDADALVHAG